MSIFKQKYDPEYHVTYVFKKGYALSQEKHLIVDSGESHVSWLNIISQLAWIGLAAGLATVFAWPFALLALVIPVIWFFVPETRLVTQKKLDMITQKGTAENYNFPTVNWNLFYSSDLYRIAVVEWFDALRITKNPKDNGPDWRSYIKEHERLAKELELNQVSVKPNAEKLQLLKELMEGN